MKQSESKAIFGRRRGSKHETECDADSLRGIPHSLTHVKKKVIPLQLF